MNKQILELNFKKRQALNPNYSMRAFARDLKLSPASLSQFLSGKRMLSRQNQLKVKKALCLPEHGPLTVPNLELDTFALMADWYHLAILNLIEIHTIRSPSDVKKHLAVSLKEAEDSLALLTKLEFVAFDKSYRRKVETLNILSQAPSEALRKHNRDKMELAILAQENIQKELRDISSLTLKIDAKKLEALKDEIRHFKSRIIELSKEQEANEIYSLNIQFFPITRSLK